MRESDDTEFLVWEFFMEVGKIEVAGLRVFQMRTGDMYLAFLQPRQCKPARRRGGNYFNTADLLDHVRKYVCCRITTCENQPFIRRLFFCKNNELGAAAFLDRAFDDSIRLRHVIRRSADWNTNPTSID